MKKLSDKQKEMLKLHSKPHKNKSGKNGPVINANGIK